MFNNLVNLKNHIKDCNNFVLSQIVMLSLLFVCLIPSGVSSISGSSSFTVTAYAKGNNKTSINQNSLPFIIVDSDSGVSEVVNNINNQIQVDLYVNDSLNTDVTKNWKFLYWDANTKKVTLDRVTFTDFGINTRKKVMDIALANLSVERARGMSARDRARLYSFIEDQDEKVANTLKALNSNVDADIKTADTFLAPIYPFVNTFLGVILIVVSCLLLLQMALDIFCMSNPIIMSMAIRKFDKTPWFISPEAWYAYKDAIGGDVFKSYMVGYLKNSSVKFICTSLSIALIVGNNVASLALFIANLINR